MPPTQASGAEFIKIYHIDKTTDQVVTLGDLFQPDADYVSVLSDEVRRQMEERMAEDEAAGYFGSVHRHCPGPEFLLERGRGSGAGV